MHCDVVWNILEAVTKAELSSSSSRFGIPAPRRIHVQRWAALHRAYHLVVKGHPAALDRAREHNDFTFIRSAFADGIRLALSEWAEV